jgi:hypothetical protein
MQKTGADSLKKNRPPADVIARGEDRPMQTDLDVQKLSETLPDRRRHARYRFSVPINIYAAGGVAIRGISLEISESGLSAITATSLQLGAIVELEPVLSNRVSALVRRNVGRIYGFEFLNLTAEQTRQINESCKTRARYQTGTLGI